MGEAYSVFWWGNLREKKQLQFLGIDGKIILKWIFKKWDAVTDWIHLAQDNIKMGI
jgi:hypothetical protein